MRLNWKVLKRHSLLLLELQISFHSERDDINSNSKLIVLRYACHEIIAAQLDELRSTIIEAINHPIVSINTSMVGRISDNQGVVGKHLAFDKKCQETLKSVYFRIDSANLALILARLAPNTSLWSYNRLCGYILGSIQYLSQRRIIVSNGFQDAKSDLMEYQRDRRVLTIILPLLRYVVIYKSSAIYSKWTRSVILSRVISDKSPIWHLCSKGDIMGMRRLFEAGLASPYDISSCGRSLLHVMFPPSEFRFPLKWI